MLFIWRGIGLIVPIMYFLVAWIVSFWYDKADTKIVNTGFMGWTSLIAGIIILLIGLATFNSHKNTNEQGKPVGKKHDFFYIPILYWGIFFTLLSIYLLVFTEKKPSPEEMTVEIPEPTDRILCLYNPSAEPLTYIIADETGQGLIERETVEPGKYVKTTLNAQTYLFSAYNENSETTLLLPDREDAGDTTKYILYEDEKGLFYQRILRPATKTHSDYDEAWLVLDGKHHLVLVDVTNVCSGKLNTEDVNDFDWEKRIEEIFDAKDLIEPLYQVEKKGKSINIIAPGDKLPSDTEPGQIIYMLIPFNGEKPDNTFIANYILSGF